MMLGTRTEQIVLVSWTRGDEQKWRVASGECRSRTRGVARGGALGPQAGRVGLQVLEAKGFKWETSSDAFDRGGGG